MKAVVFVDVQKDFIDGALRNEKAIEVTPRIVEFAKESIKNGYKIYATRDTHEKTKYQYHFEGETMVKEPTSGYLVTFEGQKLPIEHCVEGTDGWMIDERLWNVIEGKSTVVNKTTFGSIDLAEILAEDDVKMTDLHNLITSGHHLLKNSVIEEIVICGFCTSICVLANAVLLRARFPNTKITVMKDLCADVNEENHNSALKCLRSQFIDVV